MQLLFRNQDVASNSPGLRKKFEERMTIIVA